MTDDFLLFAGSASKKLGAAIAEYLECPLGASETIRFSEGNLFVRVLENVRGRHTFLVQGTAFPANDNFMELLFWIYALKRASAESVTAVIHSATPAGEEGRGACRCKGGSAPMRSRPPA